MTEKKIVEPRRGRHILIIDNCNIEGGEYADLLPQFAKTPLHIERCSNLLELSDYVNASTHWDFVLLDMMMPVGPFDPKRCGEGKFTGVVVSEEVRKVYPETPIMLLSNATFEDVKQACEKVEATVSNCLFWEKSRMRPKDLAAKLDEFFECGVIMHPRSLLQRIFGMIVVQPNIGGVGLEIWP